MRTAWLLILFCVCAAALVESGPSRIATANGRHIVGAEPDPPGGGGVFAESPCNGLINAPKVCPMNLDGGVCNKGVDQNYTWFTTALPGGTNDTRFENTANLKCITGKGCPQDLYDADDGKKDGEKRKCK